MSKKRQAKKGGKPVGDLQASEKGVPVARLPEMIDDKTEGTVFSSRKGPQWLTKAPALAALLLRLNSFLGRNHRVP